MYVTDDGGTIEKKKQPNYRYSSKDKVINAGKRQLKLGEEQQQLHFTGNTS